MHIRLFANNLPLNLEPEAGTPFNDGVLRVANMPFVEFMKINHWEDLFPYPNGDIPLPFTPFSGFIPRNMPGYKTVREERLEWELQALKFFVRCQSEIDSRLKSLEYLFSECLEQWKKENRGISESASELTVMWCKSSKMTVKELCSSFFTIKIAGDFLRPYAEEWRNNRGLPNEFRSTNPIILPNSRASLYEKLLPFVKESQRIYLFTLIHTSSYQQQPIICYCKQVDIGKIFYEYVQAGKIKGSRPRIAKWICHNFRRYSSDRAEEFSEGTLLNYLKGKSFADPK